MVKSVAEKIERRLQRFVWEARRNDEDATVTTIRQRAEKDLGFSEGFFKTDKWRKRSKVVIQAAFAQPEEAIDQPDEAEEDPRETSKESASALEQKSDEINGEVKSKASNAAVTKQPQKTASQVNGVKRKASQDSGTTSASAGKEVAEPSPKKKAKVSQAAGAKSTVLSETVAPMRAAESSRSKGTSDEGSSSGSGSIESEKGQAQQISVVADSAAPPKPAPTKQTAAAGAEERGATHPIPSKAYKPPSGYNAVATSFESGHRAFSEVNLQGKQIWHITAPSDVPLSSLTELALSSIAASDPILTHKSVPYILSEDKTVSSDTSALLIPSKEGYEKLQSKISRSLHLQQKIDLPNLTMRQASQMTGSNAAGDIAQAAVSTVRPQPKGLRMRFKPPGFGEGKPGRIGGGSESEDNEPRDESRPSFQFPKTLGQHGTEIMQDGDVEMVDAAEIEGEAGKAEKKAKKKVKPKEDTSADAESSKLNGIPKATPAKEHKLPNSATTKEEESKEERKRRKAEKQARKEAKAKMKELVHV